MAEPVYKWIEFTSDPRTLWGKLKEGRWDWLGVKPKGTFVLGSPRRGGVLSISASISTSADEAVDGNHVVRVDEPSRRIAEHNLRTNEEAIRTFQEKLDELDRKVGPQLFRVRRYEHGTLEAEEFIVSRPSTMR